MSDLSTHRPVSFSAVREQVYMIFPNDLNSNDTVFGGLILAQLDRAWGSSLEVGCKVEAQLLRELHLRHALELKKFRAGRGEPTA